jgi:hypothetical protein
MGGISLSKLKMLNEVKHDTGSVSWD